MGDDKTAIKRLDKEMMGREVMPTALAHLKRLASSQYGPSTDRKALQALIQAYEARLISIDEAGVQIEELASDVLGLAEENALLAARLAKAEEKNKRLTEEVLGLNTANEALYQVGTLEEFCKWWESVRVGREYRMPDNRPEGWPATKIIALTEPSGDWEPASTEESKDEQ